MSTHPSISIETITPDQAEAMLELNTNNRTLRADRVATYAAAMKAGEWLMTGEPIIFSGTDLINGQHRLFACIAADKPFTTAVVRDAPAEAYNVIDSGLTRSAGDTLSHSGVMYSSHVASASRLVIAYRNGLVADNRRLSAVATRARVLAEATRSKDRYEHLARRAFNSRKDGYNITAFIAFGLLLGEAVGEAEADAWMDVAVTGIGLEAGDVRLALRRWVIQAARPTATVELSAWVRSRNATVMGQSRQVIRPWVRTQPFPQLIEEGHVPEPAEQPESVSV